ncbi:hypothetical protein [Candidatus Nitrosocosmicus franklandus]|uniref:SWIM-type domain-containing protein n=1 Tax=Candidatus Nitrosocosmicus franklandianus TaxID=1798806 RepID=A0A484IC95_9ARCH|nr:hypothetical protein [Candidatus Nitrosocosmicus franklandus]VFJ12641.1 protein of unknown function [Candidatus Nitrosocosmicus franklandus]
MQIHAKTGNIESIDAIPYSCGIAEHISTNNMNTYRKNVIDELELKDPQQLTYYCYMKYRYDHVFVIGDNKLKHNVEVMIGKQTLYCSSHDTRTSEQECEHIRFVKMYKEKDK